MFREGVRPELLESGERVEAFVHVIAHSEIFLKLLGLVLGASGGAIRLPERPTDTYYFTAGPKRSTSSFHEATILAFVFRAL